VSAPPPGAATEAVAQPPPDRALRVIAVYKFGKALLMAALALGTLRLLNPEVAAWADRWATALALRHDRRLLGNLIALISGLSNRRLHELAVGAFAVMLLFLTEGVGLWVGKRWAQYLTVVATMLFIPFEIVQVARLVTATRVAALLVSLAVVVFLIFHLRKLQAPRPA
jgi:uncharacterized membrane protein (DUF2068 family)